MNATEFPPEATPEVTLNVALIEQLLSKRELTSVKDRAAFLGLHRATYSSYLKGTLTPSLPAAMRMAQRLGVKVEALATYQRQVAA